MSLSLPLTRGLVVYYCLYIILVTDTEVDLERQSTKGTKSSIPLTPPFYLPLSMPLGANVLLSLALQSIHLEECFE